MKINTAQRLVLFFGATFILIALVVLDSPRHFDEQALRFAMFCIAIALMFFAFWNRKA